MSDDLTEDDMTAVDAALDGVPAPENWNGPTDSPHEGRLSLALARLARDLARLRRIEAAARCLCDGIDAQDVPAERRELLLHLVIALADDGGS